MGYLESLKNCKNKSYAESWSETTNEKEMIQVVNTIWGNVKCMMLVKWEMILTPWMQKGESYRS